MLVLRSPERCLADYRVADFPHLRFISHETVTIFHQRHIPQLLANGGLFMLD
jgi:hypothetical protein